jgi:carboxypeptidase C (cathepsin A)
MKIFDRLPWNGHAMFQRMSYEDWFWVDASSKKQCGGAFKSHGKLSVVTVDEAGHMSPHDQPEATLQVMKRWIGDYGSLKE